MKKFRVSELGWVAGGQIVTALGMLLGVRVPAVFFAQRPQAHRAT
jgi:hypothetical protein